MTPNDIIEDARRLAQDNALFRAPDAYTASTMLRYTNQIIKNTALLRPDLFIRVTDIVPTAEVAEQTAPVDSIRFVSIRAVKNGPAVVEVSYETMDRSYPNWRSDPAGTPVNYMRNIRNPNSYFLYPRPAAGIVLTGEYVQSPPDYAANQSIMLLPDSFRTAMAAGVVMLVANTENDAASANRATQFSDLYTQALQANLQSRNITDTRMAGLDPRETI